MYRDPQPIHSLRFVLLGLLAFVPTANTMARYAPPSSAVQPSEANQADKPVDDKGKGKAKASPNPSVNLTNPRATMETFLIAIDAAQQGQVERYDEVFACLDLSGLANLPDEARLAQARKLAGQLNDFIDKHGVERETIPKNPSGDRYDYPEGSIQIRRFDDGVWRFTRSSLEFVAGLKPATQASGTPAQPAEPVKTKPTPPQQAATPHKEVPAAYRSARATMRTFRAAVQKGRLDEAAKCLDLSDYPVVIRNEKGMELAGLLQEVITRTKPIVLQEFPDDPAGNAYVFRQDDKGIIVLARQGDGSDRPGTWLFTRETVAGLDSLYDNLVSSGSVARGEPIGAKVSFNPSLWLRSHIPDSLKGTWLLLKHWQWLGLVIALLLGILAQRCVTVLLRGMVRLWLKRHRASVKEGVQVSLLRPVGFLAASAVWWPALTWLSLPAGVLTVLLTAVKFTACGAMVWTVYRAVDLICDYFASLAAKTETKVDDLLVPLARKVAKTFVTIIGVVFIIQQFTTNRVPELLAGLGLGGLALALAAQDTLKNLFGSLTVITDRPFEIGDWVLVGEVEGTVESVGFRSTRIRTFYNSRVTLPNAMLMNAMIDNFGARRYRRTRTMLSITYSTPPEKIDAFCEGIRELIRLHPHTRKDYYHVYLNQFSASSLDILLYVFFDVRDWGTELRERHRLFIDIIRLADKLGVEFAFPTQTVWLERSRHDAEPSPLADYGKDSDQVGVSTAAELFKEVYGTTSMIPPPVVIDTEPRSKRMRPD